MSSLTKNKEDKSKCPCCSFDLFLPPSEKDDNDDVAVDQQQDFEEESNDESDHGRVQNVNEAVSRLLALSDRRKDESYQKSRFPCVVDTHGHPQLNRERDDLYGLKIEDDENDDDIIENRLHFRSLACSVEPQDFLPTLDYAATSDAILPALGVHPWYIPNIDTTNNVWLEELENLLLEHPTAIVGEIGLCKMARWVRSHPDGKAAALDIQRHVFKQQMELAAKLQRPVSVHCVNAHGMFVSVIKELTSQSMIPKAIGMHSFTGTANHIKELLNLEQEINAQSTQQQPIFYFGFSHAINYAMCTSDKARRKGQEAVQAVPNDRIMVESDVHNPKDVLGGTIGAISYVSWARHTPIQHIAEMTARNGVAFLSAVS